MITWENYEEYMIMYTDGELKADEEQALIKFTNEHPELKTELAAYERARLFPNQTEVYEGKQSLMKSLPVKHKVTFPLWQKYGIAAAIAALVFVSLFKWKETDDNTKTGVVVDSMVKPSLKQSQSTAMLSRQTDAVRQKMEEAMKHRNSRKAKKGAQTQTPIAHIGNMAVHNAKNIYNNTRTAFNADQKKRRDMIAIKELPIARIKKIQTDNIASVAPARIEVPVYALSINNNIRKRTFLDKLPLGETNKDQIKDIANAIAGTYEQISNFKKNLADKSVDVEINKKTLLLTF